jgi:hypothetical protein
MLPNSVFRITNFVMGRTIVQEGQTKVADVVVIYVLPTGLAVNTNATIRLKDQCL